MAGIKTVIPVLNSFFQKHVPGHYHSSFLIAKYNKKKYVLVPFLGPFFALLKTTNWWQWHESVCILEDVLFEKPFNIKSPLKFSQMCSIASVA